MNIYLNDWSLNCDKDILESWKAVEEFKALLGELAKINNLHLFAPENFWDSPILGFNVKTNTCVNGSSIPKEHFLLLKALYNKFCIIKDELPHFAEDDQMTIPSSTIGLAAAQLSPIISFTFDEKYKIDSLSGWLKIKDSSILKTKVNNIFEIKSSNYQLIVDLTPCKKLNPLEKPLWNKELAEKLLEGVDFIKQDTKSRQGLLCEYGKMVAEMNGWILNEKVSKLNKNAGQLRYIFDSSLSFTSYPIAYLSIDMEGPGLAFELCDKRGQHQGERSWNGTSKEAKNNHDIRVK